jgi:nucleoside-diphosphate-sugar epimerase
MCPPAVVDVRDVAKAHVRALEVGRKEPEQKRYLVNGGNLSWKEAAIHLKKVHPELNVTKPEDIKDLPGPASKYDTSRAEADLGIKEWIKPEDTIVAAAESLLEAMKGWGA